MEKYYSFAGVEISVEIPDEKMYGSDGTLANFRVDSVRNPHRFSLHPVDQLTAPSGTYLAGPPGYRIYRDGDRRITYVGQVLEGWEEAYLRVEHLGREHRIQALSLRYPDRVSTKAVLTALEVEHLVTEAGGFVFHSACIETGGGAVLFTAPSGTGKSTQAELWKQHRGAAVINGDRSVIRRTAEGPMACGIPFAGSSVYCENRVLPLRAVVYLKQAPVTTIRRLKGMEAFRRIWEGVSVHTWDRNDLEIVMGLVENMLGQVPVFELSCTPDESAVLALEGRLGKEFCV